MKNKLYLLPIFLLSILNISSCKNSNSTINFKEYIELVNNELNDKNKQDIFVFVSSSCTSCKKIEPFLQKYIDENTKENLSIYKLSLDISNFSNSFKDKTMGYFSGDEENDCIKRLDKRITKYIFETKVSTGDDKLINVYPFVDSKYTYIFTPLIIWYQNGLEKKISNNVLNCINTESYDSFVEFMEYPTSQTSWNEQFNLTSL